MARLLHVFIKDAAPVLEALGDFKRMLKYTQTLDLKRCPYIMDNAGYIRWNMPVRAVVNVCSPVMSNCLWGEKITPEEVLESIDNFKWVPYRRSKKRAAYKQRASRAYQATKRIGERELDKNHDWETVK